MKIVQAKKSSNEGWEYLSENSPLKNPLVLVFGGRFELEKKEVIEDIRKEFPYENLVFGSTSGEIIGAHVFDTSIVVTAIEFEKSSFIVKTANIFDFDKNAKLLGEKLIQELPKAHLKHVFVLSEGSFKIELESINYEIQEVQIFGDKQMNLIEKEPGLEKLNVKVIKELPTMMGESDIVKVSEMLPGVVSVGEGAAGRHQANLLVCDG